MRADAGGRALVLPCPQCPTRWSTEQTLAGHLMDRHEMDPPAAVKRALEVSAQVRRGRAIKDGMQRAQEETTAMADEAAAKPAAEQRCTDCRRLGHGYADCPRAQERRAGKKRQPVTRRDPKATASPNGFAGALQALRAERTELDAAIAALERLEARR